jgi:rhodanese-related sulfurtransferase
VVALKNGTMGWELAGLAAERGCDNMVAEPVGPALETARMLARDVAKRHKLSFMTVANLEAMRAQSDRTTYVFDVRLADAFVAGHLPGSLNAPGGQLVQATDTFAPVRGARIVLVDQHEVQAVMTAHWLRQMGWVNVHVLRNGLSGPLETGPAVLPCLGEFGLTAPTIEASALRDLLVADAPKTQVIDVGESYWYRAGRVPGSCYAMRSRLRDALSQFRAQTPLVFVCSDGRVSRYAAQDAINAGCLKRLVERRDLGHRVHDAEAQRFAELLRDGCAGGALGVDRLAIEREAKERGRTGIPVEIGCCRLRANL